MVATENGSVPLEETPVHRAEFKSVSLKYNTFINAAIIVIFIITLHSKSMVGKEFQKKHTVFFWA